MSSGEQVGRHNVHAGEKKASRYLPDNGDMAARDNKFQRRPVACAVRDAEARQPPPWKDWPFSRYRSRDLAYVTDPTLPKLSDWPFRI